MEKDLTLPQRLENLIRAYNDVLMSDGCALQVDKMGGTWTITCKAVNTLIRFYLLLDAESLYCCFFHDNQLKVFYLD